MSVRSSAVALALAIAVPHAAAQQASPAPPVFKAEAAVIRVDAIVTDAKGHQVTDLTAADFEFEWAGQKRPVTFCTYLAVAETPHAPLVGGAKPTAEDVGRVIAFVIANPFIDAGRSASELAMRRADRAARMLESFIEHQVGPRDLVGIFNMEGRKPLLAQFTTDRDAMRAATKEVRTAWLNAPPVVVMPGRYSSWEHYDVDVLETAGRLVERLSQLPGRKLVFVVSSALRITGARGTVNVGDFSLVRAESDRLIQQANHAGVTLYGVSINGMAGSYSDALGYLADGTGGSTIEMTENLDGGLERVLEQNAGYYLLGYEPKTLSERVPERIKVRLLKQGLHLSARPQALAQRPQPGRDAYNAARARDLLNSPFSPGGLSVHLRHYLRWTSAKQGELLQIIDVDTAGLDLTPDTDGRPKVELNLVARVTREDGINQLFDQKPKGLRFLGAVPDQLSFSNKVPLPVAGSYQSDAAVTDLRNDHAGNATEVVALPSLSGTKLLASTLILRDSPEGLPKQAFAKDATIHLLCQVAHARRAHPVDPARLQLQGVVLKDGVAVLEGDPATVEHKTVGDPFDVETPLRLLGVAPGDYTIELRIADLVAGKTSVVAASPLRILDR